MIRRHVGGIALVCAAALSGPVPIAAQAPSGFRTWENKLQAWTFAYPNSYQEVPLPPTEQVEVAKFVITNKPEECKRVHDQVYDALKPQLVVFQFTVESATTGPAKDPAAEAKGPSTVREAMEQQGRVTSWEQFTQRFGNWRFDEDRKKPGSFTMVFTGEWRAPSLPVGSLVRKQEGNTVYGVYGITLTEHGKAQQGHVQKMAGTLKPAEAEDGEAAAAAIDKLYATGKYRAVEFRKKARSAMPKGWKAVDTENFLVVHHSKNLGLVNRIARDVEAMRAYYAEVFPPVGAMESLSVVRICRTMEEYHQYGGPPNTGGYWHPGNEELVFYDYSYTMKTLDDDERKRLGKAKLTDDDSLLVLYHEALHQYIHYAIGEFSPHDWFNEGYGDYFSGAVVGESTGRVLRIDPSPWRIHVAKDMCEFSDGWIPLKEILNAERAVFYHPTRVRWFYAGAWSFVFFLKHAKEVAAHPQWSKLLQVYFDTVKSSYLAEVQKLGAEADLTQKQMAGVLARKTALKTMLEGVDLPELERTWRKWVVDMKDPWPSQRKKRK